METATRLGKAEDKKAIEALVTHPGFALFRKELQRKIDVATEEACDLDQSQTKRDAAAGARKALKELDAYPGGLIASLTDTLKKNR